MGIAEEGEVLIGHTTARQTEQVFDLVEKENKSLILVTHNPELAGQCRKIFTLSKGLLVS